MNKDVIISISGNQDHIKSGGDSIELVTEGNYYQKNGKSYIIYKESEMTGFGDGTTTTLKIDGSVVTMIRTGSSSSQMVFEHGKKHLGHYETPFGSFTVGTISNGVKVDIDEKGGDIEIDYSVEIDSVLQGHNDLHLKFREA